MTTMLEAIRRDRPHLLISRPMCEHCGVHRAQVGVLCAICNEDPEERAAFEAKCAEQEAEDDVSEKCDASYTPVLRPCRWGGCNGVGPDGGHCNRCGSPVV